LIDRAAPRGLNNNRLEGSIPSELGRLSLLTLLYVNTGSLIANRFAINELRARILSTNNLTGTLPRLGDLTALEYLGAAENLLGGTIPEVATDSLRWVYLFSNQLVGTVPTALQLGSKLELLHLYSNRLVGPILTSPFAWCG
jgi:hypothetical protein